jgi:hypothetical protein
LINQLKRQAAKYKENRWHVFPFDTPTGPCSARLQCRWRQEHAVSLKGLRIDAADHIAPPRARIQPSRTVTTEVVPRERHELPLTDLAIGTTLAIIVQLRLPSR